MLKTDKYGLILSALIPAVLILTSCAVKAPVNETFSRGAVIRGDSTRKALSLVFTGDEFADGGEVLLKVLAADDVEGAFFLTGNFYRNPEFSGLITDLKNAGHYLGAHSDRHLLYCSWSKRDSLLVTRREFEDDLLQNYMEMAGFGISPEDAPFFLPPYEWYNDSIAVWTKDLGFTLINYTPGTLSHADYTILPESNYRDSETIFQNILNFERENGLKGFILLTHIGCHPERPDPFYERMDELIRTLKDRDYDIVPLQQLLGWAKGDG